MSTLIENPSDIFSRAVILKLTIGKPGNRAKLRADQYQVDAEQGWTAATRQLLKSPEVTKAIKRQDKLRTDVKKLALPSPLGDGTYLMAIDTILRTEKLITQAQADMPALLAEVQRMYPTRIEEAKVAQNGLFNPADYPPVEEFLSDFYITSRYIAYGAPETLAKVRDDLLEREKGKITSDTMAAVQDIFTVLRMDMKGLVDKLVARTVKADGGKNTRFKGLLDNITEFLETLPLRNIVDDGELAKLGEQAQAILRDVTPDLIREDRSIREYVAKEFAGIQSTLDEMVTLKGKRFIEAV